MLRVLSTLGLTAKRSAQLTGRFPEVSFLRGEFCKPTEIYSGNPAIGSAGSNGEDSMPRDKSIKTGAALVLALRDAHLAMRAPKSQ